MSVSRHHPPVGRTLAILTALLAGPVSLLAQSMPAAASGAAEAIQLEALEVTGTRPQLIDNSTLKMPTRIIETPRAVSILDATRIDQQNFQNANDFLDWIPGLNANAGSYHFFARGFRMGPSDWKVDGFAGRVVGGSYSPNLFGYEQAIALKGPAGVLYGAASQPGGQINLVTKKPRAEARTTVSTRLRSFAGGGSGLGDDSTYEVEFDSTGALTADQRLLYRFLASEDHGAAQPGADDDNSFYRAALSYALDRDQRFVLTPAIEWSRETRAQRPVAISPNSSRTTTDGRTDYDLSDATPAAINLNSGGRTDENVAATLDLNGRLTAAWTVDASLRYHERDYVNSAWTIQTATLRQADATDPRSWEVSRRHNRTRRDYENLAFDVHTTYTASHGAHISSVWQLGLNYAAADTRSYTSINGANQSPVNIYTGIATTPLVADATGILAPTTLARTSSWNTYLQNQTTFYDRFILNLSGAFVGDRTESIAADGTSSGVVSRDSDVTPNLGLVFLPTPKTAIYASYSTSYSLPNASYEDAGGATGGFSPTEGENFELGTKADLWGEVLAASLSVFQTELNNTLVQSEPTDLNPNGNRYYTQVDGGRASQGVEFEITVAPVRRWSTTLSYAYLDAHDRNADGTAAGSASMTPRHAVSLFSRYAFAPDSTLGGWSVQAGLITQSARWGGQGALSATNTDPLRLEPYTRLDFGVAKSFRHWSAALNIENLLDEAYLAGGSTGLNLQWANPRNVTLRVARTW